MTHDVAWYWAIAWPIVSGCVNALFRMKSPEEWWEWSKTNPRLAGFVRLVSALGFDGAKALNALQQMAGK